MASVQRGKCYDYGRDGSYDCQECGRPETEAMQKRVQDFARPTCDECIVELAHRGHVPGDWEVVVVSVTVSHGLGPDGKVRMVEKRDERRVKYKDFEGRCRKCLP
jgi:hypothetical protein